MKKVAKKLLFILCAFVILLAPPSNVEAADATYRWDVGETQSVEVNETFNLTIETPSVALIKWTVTKDGNEVASESTIQGDPLQQNYITDFVAEVVFTADEPGTYNVEIYIDAADNQAESTRKETLNRTIQIDEYETKTETRTETVPFEIKEDKDVNLEKGIVEVDVSGVDGEKEIRETVTYKNGEEVSREIISEEVTIQPVTQEQRIGAELREETSEEIVEIPFETIEKENPDKPEGYKKTIVEGVNGSKKIITTKTYIDDVYQGEATDKVEEVIIENPINEEVEVGTKVLKTPTITILDTNGEMIAWTLDAEEDSISSITINGEPLKTELYELKDNILTLNKELKAELEPGEYTLAIEFQQTDDQSEAVVESKFSIDEDGNFLLTEDKANNVSVEETTDNSGQQENIASDEHESTVSEKNVNSNVDTEDAPRTGDAGISTAIIVLIVTAGIFIFLQQRKKTEE